MTLLPARLRAQPPALLFLILADLCAILAMGIGSVAMNWWIVTHGNASELALFNISAATLMLAITLFGSGLGDRYCKAKLMVFGTALAAISGILLALYASLADYHILPLILLYSLDVIGFAIVIPVSSSMAADIIEADKLTEALAIQKSGQSIGRLGGFTLGGALVATLSIPLALAIWSGMMVFATVVAMKIPQKTASAAANVGRNSLLHDAWLGVRARWQIPLERYWSLYAMLQMMLFIPCIGMLLPLHIHQLGLNAQWLGLAEAMLGGGMLLGALWIAQPLARRIGRLRAAVMAMCLNGAAALLIGLSGMGWTITLAMLVIGCNMSISQLIGQTHRMLAVPDDFRSRFSATNLMIANLSAIGGQSLAAALLLWLPVSQVYQLYGAIIFVMALCFPLLPDLRRMLALSHDEVKGIYLREYPQAFASGKIANARA